MVNINLSTGQTMQSNKEGIALSQRGIVVIASILLLVIMVTGGLMVWRSILEGKIADNETEYGNKLKALMTNARNKDIVDFQNRLSLSGNLVSQPNVALDILQEIEKTLSSGVYLSSFKIDEKSKTLYLECVADNYESIARQVLNFKSSKYFSEVDVKNMNIDDDGKNEFTIDIKIN